MIGEEFNLDGSVITIENVKEFIRRLKDRLEFINNLKDRKFMEKK